MCLITPLLLINCFPLSLYFDSKTIFYIHIGLASFGFYSSEGFWILKRAILEFLLDYSKFSRLQKVHKRSCESLSFLKPSIYKCREKAKYFTNFITFLFFHFLHKFQCWFLCISTTNFSMYVMKSENISLR